MAVTTFANIVIKITNSIDTDSRSSALRFVNVQSK